MTFLNIVISYQRFEIYKRKTSLPSPGLWVWFSKGEMAPQETCVSEDFAMWPFEIPFREEVAPFPELNNHVSPLLLHLHDL